MLKFATLVEKLCRTIVQIPKQGGPFLSALSQIRNGHVVIHRVH
uniref:Uncharacterized protein n=1 Tax=Rhizophora mucronata TaxID=61149 RepID=A0A2P2LNA9_RHIMU